MDAVIASGSDYCIAGYANIKVMYLSRNLNIRVTVTFAIQMERHCMIVIYNIKILPLISILSGLWFSTSAQKDGDLLFDNSYLHQIKIESESIPDVWDSISRDYVLVNMNIDGKNVDSVGIKMKGSTSAHAEQKPLEVDLNEFVSGKKYDGLNKFELRNNYTDTYLQREGLAYELYRRAGLPSSRTAYAEVYVDNVFRGIYSITETIDKNFLNHYFPSKDGSLYKGEFGARGFSVEVKEGSMTEFDVFKRNLRSATLGDYVKLDHYLKQLATDIIIGDWDSYAYYRHNFYIYYETKSKLLNFINWDHNFAFSAKPESNDLYPLGTFPSSINLIESPDLKLKYEQTMCQLLTYLVDDTYVTKIATHNYNIINSNDNGIIADNPAPLLEYISNRKQQLQDTLTSIGVSCNKISYPLGPGDLVINEIMASTDITNSEASTDGDTPDWIEIYNNSPSAITLDNHFYLSDDKNFPKKWNFQKEVTIPPKGYLIVWADNNIEEPGIHAGFKIEKSGGNILMTYENMKEIQNIKYGKQTLNMGYARFPNGTGDFVIQPPTFNSANN